MPTNKICPPKISRFCPMDSLRLIDSLRKDFQDVIGLFVDYLSTVNDFLAALYYCRLPRIVVEQFFPGCLRTYRIVNEIGGNVLVECTLPQDVSVIMGGITRYKILVGSLYGIDARRSSVGWPTYLQSP